MRAFGALGGRVGVYIFKPPRGRILSPPFSCLPAPLVGWGWPFESPTGAHNQNALCLLSGPLNRLNAILSLLQPLDRYRAPSALESAIGEALSRPISHPHTVVGVLNRLVLNRLGGSTAR